MYRCRGDKAPTQQETQMLFVVVTLTALCAYMGAGIVYIERKKN